MGGREAYAVGGGLFSKILFVGDVDRPRILLAVS